MYLEDMPGLCRSRATNPEYPLELLKSIQKEFDKGLNGGIFDPCYVLRKLETLTRHVTWLADEADAILAAQCEPEEDEEPRYTTADGLPFREEG